MSHKCCCMSDALGDLGLLTIRSSLRWGGSNPILTCYRSLIERPYRDFVPGKNDPGEFECTPQQEDAPESCSSAHFSTFCIASVVLFKKVINVQVQ